MMKSCNLCISWASSGIRPFGKCRLTGDSKQDLDTCSRHMTHDEARADAAESRILSLESQLAAERARWEELRAVLNRIATDEGVSDWAMGYRESAVRVEEAMDKLASHTHADVVRVTVARSDALLNRRLGLVEFPGDKWDGGEFYLVRIKVPQ